MKTVICHPDNWSKVNKSFQKQIGFSFGLNVVVDASVEKDKPTGRYLMPSGNAVEKQKVVLHDGFFLYGPEDIDWLLYAGKIREEREMVFYVVDDELFRVRCNLMPAMYSSIKTHLTA